MPIYRHRQSSLLLPALALLMLAAAGAAAVAGQRPGGFIPLLIAALFLAVLSFCFSSLTIDVDDDKLVWFFGPGIWRKQIARADIAAVETVRNRWWYGFGIRLTPRGWLYNVGGLDAVEITLADGKKLRIGTDEPKTLAATLKDR